MGSFGGHCFFVSETDLHLDVEDASLLLDLLLDDGHGLVEHGEALGSL